MIQDATTEEAVEKMFSMRSILRLYNITELHMLNQ
jgi:hypothetical protein